MNDINEFLKTISMLQGIGDIIRAVDPVNNKVINLEKSEINEYKHQCHMFWGGHDACKNCVAMKAMVFNDTFVKVEYNKEKMFMVSASPLVLGDTKYIIEIIKNITNRGIICDLEKKSVNEINEEIRKLNNDVLMDELTGIYNKRYIDENFHQTVKNNIMDESPISVIMVDIDLFKRVNDIYGHLAGDQVIKEFARFLNNAIRKGKDWVARYGGEEFLIVLNNTDKNTAFKISERMREGISNKVFNFEGKEIKITASFGIGSLEDFKSNPTDLIKKADENLYRAKREGRNKTIY